MSIERLLRVFELERQVLGAGTLKCPLSAIEAAEKKLNLVFPPTYRYYLEHIHLNSQTEIFGIERNVGASSDYCSVLVHTFDLRDDEGLPEKYILIDQDYIWQHVLDSARVNEAGESPILHWWDGVERVVYPDFDSFYLEMVNGAIYRFMMDKADDPNQQLPKVDVENYIDLHLNLGFTENEHQFLKQHWEEFRSIAH